MANRLNKVETIFANCDVDLVAIIPGSNFRYLTGGNFHLMERPTVLLLTKNSKPVVILPILELDVFNKLKGYIRCLIIGQSEQFDLFNVIL